jgi:hypothetical protein
VSSARCRSLSVSVFESITLLTWYVFSDLSPSRDSLRFAMRGLMALRSRRHIESSSCSRTLPPALAVPRRDVPLEARTGPWVWDTKAHRQAFDRITGSAVEETRVLQVFSVSKFVGDTEPEFCLSARKRCRWHVEMRGKAWAASPVLLGLRA